MKTTTLATALIAAALVLAAGAAVLGTSTDAPNAVGSDMTDPTDDAAPSVEDLVNEDIEDPLITDLTGCDGLHVTVTDAGEADVFFYTWNEDDEQEECDPAGGGAAAAGVEDLVNEDIEDPLITDLTGCDGLHVTVTDAGEADVFFYTWNEDEEQDECDPAGGGAAPAAFDDLVNENVEDPLIKDLTGCDGLHVAISDAGQAEAAFYNWNEDDEQEECDPLA